MRGSSAHRDHSAHAGEDASEQGVGIEDDSPQDVINSVLCSTDGPSCEDALDANCGTSVVIYEEWQERAAIREFDGNQDRQVAELKEASGKPASGTAEGSKGSRAFFGVFSSSRNYLISGRAGGYGSPVGMLL
jgi:hypothetical protein